MSGIPFFNVAFFAVLVHIIGGIIATLTEAIFNSRGWTHGMTGGNATIRLFTAQRRQVRFLASWVLILVARAALAAAAISSLLGLLTRSGWG